MYQVKFGNACLENNQKEKVISFSNKHEVTDIAPS